MAVNCWHWKCMQGVLYGLWAKYTPYLWLVSVCACKFLSISRAGLLTQVHLTTTHPICLLYSSNQLMVLRQSLWEMVLNFLLLM